MSDNSDKPLRDLEAEDGRFAEAGAGPARSRPRRGGVLALVAALLALAGVGALGGYGYLQLLELRQAQQQLDQSLSSQGGGQEQLKGRLAALGQSVEQQGQALRQQDARFAGYVNGLKEEQGRYEQGRAEMLHGLNAVQKRIGRSTSRWMAAEAEYLIRVASHRLQLEGDVATALRALQAADERLRDTADPLWGPVRKVLAEDVAQLKGIAPPNYVGLSARLAALGKQVDQLRVKSALLSHPAQTAQDAKGAEFDLDRLLADGWQGLRSLVVVRRHDQPVAAMLPPEQRFFLGQNLRLQLESARLALLRRDQALFDSALRSATAWLGEFFEAEDPATSALRQELSALAGERIHPQPPDVSGALAVLLEQAAQAPSDQGPVTGDGP